MVKVFLIITLLFVFLNGKSKENIYIKNCVECHKKIPVSIDKFFYKYLLKYSSEKEVKKSLFKYLKQPNKQSSLMSKSFIKRFGIKKKTKLSDKNLQKALDIYWEKYKVFGKLK